MSSSIAPAPKTGVVAGLRASAAPIGGSVAVLWVAYLAQLASFGLLTSMAIVPRTTAGLAGILFAPFLHGSIGHLFANTIGFLTLAPLTMIRDRRDFWAVSFLGALSSGMGAWLLGGPGTLHLGASGVIFAYLGFLMARGAFERKVGPVLLSVLVTFFFGSMVWGIFPVLAGAGISWQAHMFGFFGGVGAARILGRELRKRER